MVPKSYGVIDLIQQILKNSQCKTLRRDQNSQIFERKSPRFNTKDITDTDLKPVIKSGRKKDFRLERIGSLTSKMFIN